MKICPQCKKEYDDTWGMCFHCSVSLVDASGPFSAKDLAPIRAELGDIRGQIARLTEQLTRIEYSLSSGNDAAPEKGDVRKKEQAFGVRHDSIENEPAPRWEAAPAGPSIKRNFVQEPAEPRKSIAENFEQVLGGNWFNKLGILAVVIGVALLVGYSFRYLGAAGKIALGYAFGVGMIVFGRFIEKKQDFAVYGRSLLGGGWAIAYFTTFALHHIPAVRLVASPVLGMTLLLGVSAAAVIDIYRYRSPLATGFSYLLIFITLMISPVSLYTMAAMVPVALSLAFFMCAMKWPGFGMYGMVMTYVTFMGWFGIAQKSGALAMTREQFFVAWGFLLIYWAIFVAATLLARDDDDAGGKRVTLFSLGFREVTLVINTLIASFNAWSLLQAGFMQYIRPALSLGIGLYLGLTVLTYLMRRRRFYIVNSTVAILYAVLFLALTFTGYKLTASYLVLAQAIFLAGILLKESYWRLFSFAGLAVIGAKLLIIDSFVVKNSPLAMHLSTRTILFVFAFAVYLVNHFLYNRLERKKELTYVEEHHACLMSYAYPAIYAMGTWLDLPKVLTAPAWVILGVILLQIGVSRNGYHQRIQGYILTVGAFLRLLMSNMLVQGGVAFLSYRVLTCVPVLVVLYYCVMLLQDRKTEETLREGERSMPYLYPYMVFTLIMVLVWYEVPKNLVAPVWGVIAVAYSFRGVFAKKEYYMTIGSIAAIAAGMRAFFVNLLQAKYLVGAEGPLVYPVLTIAVLYAGNIFYLMSKTALAGIEGSGAGRVRRFLHSSRLVYGLTATVLLTALFIIKLSGVLLTVSLGLEGMLLLLAGFALKDKHWRMFGLIVLLMTLAKAFLVDLRQLSTLYYILSLIVLGIALLFVSYLYTRHKDKIKKLM